MKPFIYVDCNFFLTCAGPPLSPHPFMGFESNGSILTVTWEEPFSMDGFPVTSYNLSVYNHTSGSSYSHLMYPPQLEYNISNPLVSSTNCHTLTFSVTAINSVGSSEEDNVSGGFPIRQYNAAISYPAAALIFFFTSPTD